jgi:hypothetical protein
MKTEATEALKFLDITRLNPIHEIPRHKAELAAKIAFQEGQSNPSIKQLEWVRYSYGREISETPIGNFYIDVPNHGKIRMALVEAFCGYFDSVAEAKSQAQKIFERRVKACLNI